MSSGSVADARAAWPDAVVGSTNLPLLFSRTAMAIFWLLAYPNSMYPIDPGVERMLAVTPSLPFDFVPVGQFGIVLAPTVLPKSSLTALRCCENTNAVPLLSARTTTLMGRSGSFAPGLAAAIDGSFQRLTVPRKIPAYAFLESLRSVRP